MVAKATGASLAALDDVFTLNVAAGDRYRSASMGTVNR